MRSRVRLACSMTRLVIRMIRVGEGMRKSQFALASAPIFASCSRIQGDDIPSLPMYDCYTFMDDKRNEMTMTMMATKRRYTW